MTGRLHILDQERTDFLSRPANAGDPSPFRCRVFLPTNWCPVAVARYPLGFIL